MEETAGSKVFRLRKQRGWSHRKLADKAGVSASYLSKLERDQYKSPGSVKLTGIAEALGVALTDLTRITGNSRTKGIKPEDKLLEYFHGLSEEDQEDLIEMAEAKAKRRKRKVDERSERQSAEHA